MEESVLLRIQQLQMGLLQLTDACYPAQPDSLGVLAESKLHTKTPSQTAKPFG
jgi:hypothetical protein